MTAEARIIHHVAGLIAYQSRFGGSPRFIEDKTGEKRLSRHDSLLALSGEQVFIPLVVEAW